MLRAGIVGLPNVGKSTLFNALTSTANAQSANYPFCTIEPNIGVVSVPDERLAVLQPMVKAAKIVPTAIEFVDIAGLVKGASKGEGLGNQFLANIRETDAIIEVVRCFDDPNTIHVTGKVDPVDDIETINTELALADMASLEKRQQRLSKVAKTGDKEAQPPTPDVYQQLLNQYTAILQAQAQHKTETTNLITQYKAETAAEIAGYKADLDNQYDEAMAAVEGVTGAAQEALTAAAHAVEVAGNAVSLKPTTTIPNSSDLNTYITPGNFVVPSDEAAATISNIPIPNRGFLRAYGTNGSANVMQEYFRFSYGTRYTRLYTASSASWSAWVCVSPTFALSGDELTISY